MTKKFDSTKNTIFVDMDGVVADFDKFVMENMGRTFAHITGPKGDQEMWDFLTTVERLYFKLEPTEYAFKLMDEVFSTGANVEMLTAIPRRTALPNAEHDKREWVKKYFGNHIKVNIGPYSADKWKHAKEGDILIDDRVDNIDDWKTKGNGIGILHLYQDLNDTIEKLRKVVC